MCAAFLVCPLAREWMSPRGEAGERLGSPFTLSIKIERTAAAEVSATQILLVYTLQSFD